MSDCNCTNRRFRPEYLLQEKPAEDGVAIADYDSIEFLSGGSRLFGEVMWPDGSYTAPRPCVVLLHGYPGTARNDDLAHALRRCGCVVVVPHHRGAWGSEGKYLISHCVEDAAAIARHVHGEAFCRQFNVDPDCIFLGGHSMGCNSSLNAAKELPWLKGLILLTPYDPTRYIRTGRPELFRDLLACGTMLNSDGPEALFADVEARRDDYRFEQAFDRVKDLNLCCVAGTIDPVSPREEMVDPLWNLLEAHDTAAVQQLALFPCSHGMCNSRVLLTQFVGGFLNEVLNR